MKKFLLMLTIIFSLVSCFTDDTPANKSDNTSSNASFNNENNNINTNELYGFIKSKIPNLNKFDSKALDELFSFINFDSVSIVNDMSKISGDYKYDQRRSLDPGEDSPWIEEQILVDYLRVKGDSSYYINQELTKFYIGLPKLYIPNDDNTYTYNFEGYKGTKTYKIIILKSNNILYIIRINDEQIKISQLHKIDNTIIKL